jgi:GT2 family glycosyltransferase
MITVGQMDSSEFYIKPGVVSIIIPTKKRNKLQSLKTITTKLYLLEDALRDIKKNVACPHEVIVVCNGEPDKNYQKFILNSELIDKNCITNVNIGVPRAWNVGAQMAQGEYLCFSSDDVEIGPETLPKLIEVLGHQGVGEVGPQGTKWYRQTPGKHVGQVAIEEADNISGWLFMVKRKVYDMVGGFDVAYSPALCEEIDFSFSIRNLGLKCMVVPGLDSKHHHVDGLSSTNQPIRSLNAEIFREELTSRNRSYFEKKWEKFWTSE